MQVFHLQMELHNSLGRLLVEMVPALIDTSLCRHPAGQEGFEGLLIHYVELLKGGKDVVY